MEKQRGLVGALAGVLLLADWLAAHGTWLYWYVVQYIGS